MEERVKRGGSKIRIDRAAVRVEEYAAAFQVQHVR